MSTFMSLVLKVFSFFLKYVFILETFVYKHKCIKLLILYFKKKHFLLS